MNRPNIPPHNRNNDHDQFLRTYVMHEIKTPLICVGSIMRSMLADGDAPLDKIQMCEETIRRLTAYIEDSICLCDPTYDFINTDLEAVDLRVFRQYLSGFLGPLAMEKGLSLEIQVHNDAFTYLYMSRITIIHILGNLVTNAVKYTEPGGRIGIIWDVKELEEYRAEVKLTVRDNGRGIQQDDAAPQGRFHTNPQAGQERAKEQAGNGMGLSVVRFMVEAMHGTMRIDSRKGEGTSVEIDFQVDGSDENYMKQQEKRTAAREHREDKAWTYKQLYRGKKVLVAEDDELFMEWIVGALAKYGIYADKTYSGNEVIELFRDSGIREYDAVLMDLGLPETDGMTAAGVIRRMERADAADVPILAFTGMPIGDEQAFLARCGMQAVVPKVFDEKELIQVLSGFFAEGVK